MTTIFLCPRCRAILGNQVEQGEQRVAACQTCGSRFIPDTCDYCRAKPPGQRPCFEVEAFLREWWGGVEIPDLPKHQARLLEACALVTGEDRHTGTILTGLFRSLAAAKGFVHFTSWGISHLMLGALKLLSEQEVWVNGIVSGAYPSVIDEVTKPTADESLLMNIVAFPREDSRRAPHQKLLVIDGLLAFKGSAKPDDGSLAEGGRPTRDHRSCDRPCRDRETAQHLLLESVVTVGQQSVHASGRRD